MDGYGQRSYGGDRKFEIVSGKSANQIYSTRPHSPDPPPVAPRATRQGRTTSTPWSFSDPEMKRKKRIAKYKVYTVEGKFKDSLKNGLRWIKNKCSQIVHGY
ncbi:uncharacterized protein LOC110614445 [Manihot esculenta]|uniref:DUF3511 domain-containing protein n=1 Tax=Manihot esculenta TaxID=3983 RepID=A0A2C9VS21_MANES|nr:uncharacterized protein LOC110614445 [Manihot esculenta]OAY48734.1 hypothetical protein MANES_05G001600v8 [Manihot esculenta]